MAQTKEQRRAGFLNRKNKIGREEVLKRKKRAVPKKTLTEQQLEEIKTTGQVAGRLATPKVAPPTVPPPTPKKVEALEEPKITKRETSDITPQVGEIVYRGNQAFRVGEGGQQTALKGQELEDALTARPQTGREEVAETGEEFFGIKIPRTIEEEVGEEKTKIEEALERENEEQMRMKREEEFRRSKEERTISALGSKFAETGFAPQVQETFGQQVQLRREQFENVLQERQRMLDEAIESKQRAKATSIRAEMRELENEQKKLDILEAQEERAGKAEERKEQESLINRLGSMSLDMLSSVTSEDAATFAEGTGMTGFEVLGMAQGIAELKEARSKKDEAAIAASRASLMNSLSLIEDRQKSEGEKIIKSYNALEEARDRGDITDEVFEDLVNKLTGGEEPLTEAEQRKADAEATIEEAEATLKQIEAKEALEDSGIIGNEIIIGKGQDNPYLGKKGGSLTFRANNPGGISPGTIDQANIRSMDLGAIPGLYSLDQNGQYVLNFETEQEGWDALNQLLDEDYSDLTLSGVAERWTGTGGEGHKAAFKKRGLDLNSIYGNLSDTDKRFVAEGIAEIEGGANPEGTTIEPTKTMKKRIEPQLRAQIRAFVQSRSGVKDKDARKQLERDILKEINEGRAKTPSEAKINLGIVSDEDKEVKERITDDLKPIKKDTEEILRNVKNIDSLAVLEGGIGDTAAITAFLKTIDPGSVARESEVAGVENARGLIDNVNVWFAKLGSGDRLSKNQRESLQEVAKTLGDLAREKLFEQLIVGKQELLDRGVDPTVISQFQIDKLERDIGEERADLIRQENGIGIEEKGKQIEKEDDEDYDAAGIEVENALSEEAEKQLIGIFGEEVSESEGITF